MNATFMLGPIQLLLGLLCLGVLGAMAVAAIIAVSKMGSNPDAVPCPDCGQTVPRFAESCPHCGRPLLPPPDDQPE